MTAVVEQTAARTLIDITLFDRLAARVAREHQLSVAYAERIVDQALAFLASSAEYTADPRTHSNGRHRVARVHPLHPRVHAVLPRRSRSVHPSRAHRLTERVGELIQSGRSPRTYCEGDSEGRVPGRRGPVDRRGRQVRTR